MRNNKIPLPYTYSVKYDEKSPLITGGTNNLFRLVNYHIHEHGQWFLKNAIRFYDLKSYWNFTENIFVKMQMFYLVNEHQLTLTLFNNTILTIKCTANAYFVWVWKSAILMHHKKSLPHLTWVTWGGAQWVYSCSTGGWGGG